MGIWEDLLFEVVVVHRHLKIKNSMRVLLWEVMWVGLGKWWGTEPYKGVLIRSIILIPTNETNLVGGSFDCRSCSAPEQPAELQEGSGER